MDQHAVVGRHLGELLKGAAERDESLPAPGAVHEKIRPLPHPSSPPPTHTHLSLVMKSIMSCSSLSSVMRSLGLLLSVSTMNCCRSMPVESVYSTLGSEIRQRVALQMMSEK